MNTLDTRDLEEQLQELLENETENEIEIAELQDLKNSLEDEGWEDGIQMIPCSDFVEYTQDLVRDCYEMPDNWPFSCIDWEQAAKELEDDYSQIEYDGVDYFYRKA